MRNPKILIWFSVLCVVALLAGCGDDDSSTNPTPQPAQEPDVSVAQVTLPQALLDSPDPKAQLAASYILMANGFSVYSGFFTPPKGIEAAARTMDGPPWVHTWSQDGLTITMTIDEVGTEYHWDVVLDGTDGTIVYADWTMIHGEQAKTGAGGSMYVYDTNTTDILIQWTWSTNAQGVYAFQMVIPEDVKIEVEVNADGSGEMDAYEWGGADWERVFRMEWDAEGGMDWWEYADGVETDSGSWAPGEEPAEPPPGFTATPVTVPAHMLESEDPMAQMAVAYVQMANSMSSLVDAYFTPPEGKSRAVKTDGPPWEYTWTDGSLTITMTIDEMVGGYQWEIVLDGTDGVYVYGDWLMMHAEQTTDGSSGSMILYRPVTTEVDAEWTWSTDAYGVYTFVMTTYDSPGMRIEIVVNPDESGGIDFYDDSGGGYELVFRVEWAADGTGSYWVYSGGVETDSGTWTKS